MPRPQFTLRALLIAMFGCACFFAGMALQKRLDQPKWIIRHGNMTPGAVYTESIELNGQQWFRHVQADE